MGLSLKQTGENVTDSSIVEGLSTQSTKSYVTKASRVVLLVQDNHMTQKL